MATSLAFVASGGAAVVSAGVVAIADVLCDSGVAGFELRQPIAAATSTVASRRFELFIVARRETSRGFRFGLQFDLTVLHFYGVLHGVAAVFFFELGGLLLDEFLEGI